MITQELVTYIRGEFAKGKTREEIQKALIGGGGWSEDDLSEAFREIIPMQSAAAPKEKPIAFAPSMASAKPSFSSSPSFTPPVSSSPMSPSSSPVYPSSSPKLSPSPSFSPKVPPIISPSPVSNSPQPSPSFTPPVSSPSPSPSPSPSFSPSPSPSSSFSPSPSPLHSFNTTPPPISSPTPSRSFSPEPVMLRPNPLYKPSPSSLPPHSSHSSHFLLKFLIILIVICGLGFGAWYYRSPIISLWDSLTNKSPESPIVAVDTTPNTGTNDQAVAPVPVPPPVIQVKDCGTVGNALKLGTPSTYENNPVLSCLGESALSCENAHGIIKDDLFPTFFEIIKSTETPSSCDFKLSYGVDSTLTDITGKSLAGQYVSCPLGIVKSIDNTKPATPKFNAPNTTDLSKYAADIYFYGTLGLFIENNLDLTKIQTAGCSGDYIDTMIAGYKAKK